MRYKLTKTHLRDTEIMQRIYSVKKVSTENKDDSLGLTEIRKFEGVVFKCNNDLNDITKFLNATYEICVRGVQISKLYNKRIILYKDKNINQQITSVIDEFYDEFIFFILNYETFFEYFYHNYSDEEWELHYIGFNIACLQRELRKSLIFFIQENGTIEEAIHCDKNIFISHFTCIIAEYIEFIIIINNVVCHNLIETQNMKNPIN